MRLHVDLGSHFVSTDLITQVDNDPSYGAFSNITGDYLIPSVDGTAISVTAASYVLPIDGGDVSSQVFGQLLARFPQYRHIYFNPLLQNTDIAGLDPTATFKQLIPDPSGGPNPVIWEYSSRFQSGDPAVATMPLGTAILPLNPYVSTPRPGFLITQNIDLTAATGGVGADDFMVYWKLYTLADTDDIAGCGTGSTAGVNQPAFTMAQEIDQETANFSVYLSIDDGQNWVQVRRLQQVAFCGKTNQVKLAFRNDDSVVYHLAHFALLF